MLCDPRALTPRRSALISATACGLMARKRKENEQGEQHLDAAVDKAEETAGNVIDTAEAAATMAVEAGADIARKAKKILRGATHTAVSSGGKAAAATEKAAEGTAVAVDIAADVVEKVIDVAADASEVALEKGSELAADAAEIGAAIIEETARKGEKLAGDARDIAANVGSSAVERTRGAAGTAAGAVKSTAEAAGRKAGEAVAVAHDKLWPTYGMVVAAIVGKTLSSAAGKGRSNVLDDDWFRKHAINRTWELLPLPVRLAGKDTLRWEQVMFKLRDQVLTKDDGSMSVSSNDKSVIRSAIGLMLGRKG